MQRLHGLFHGCVGVKAMDLKQIDVVHLQTFEAGINSVENSGSAETSLIDVVFGTLHLGIAHVHCCWGFANRAEAFGKDL